MAIGYDLQSISQFGEVLERSGEALLARSFRNEEITYCHSRPTPVMHLAGTFAAKEAFLKALGEGWSARTDWREILVRRLPTGGPALEVSGRTHETMLQAGFRHVQVSISHSGDYTGACVLLWG